jgi:diguanylate cyclase (GGDEF)-like protein
MQNSSLNEATALANKLRVLIQKHTFTYQKTTLNITVSIGVSTTNEKTTTIETLYEAADKALYKAKHSGRNCVFPSTGL